MSISGPKRYVPLWDRFHVPPWAEDFLKTDDAAGPFDYPIKGGLSGCLDIEIEAVTPLFVGADQTGGQKEAKTKHWLMVDGKRAIMGTSVKGAIRSLLETATFGRFQQRIDDRRLSIRDLHNREDYVDHLNDMFRPLSKAGWLRMEGTGWTLEPCDWSLVTQEDLERYHSGRVYLGKRQGAMDKYKAWGWDNRVISFTPLPVSKEGPYAKGRELSRVRDLGSGGSQGIIVLTGQPNDRKRNRKAKSTDFIFHGAGTRREIPDQIRIDFEQIHREADGTPNTEWQVWRNRAKAGEAVPVFWLENDDGSIRAMGLSMMFRLAYKKTLHEAAKQGHRLEEREAQTGQWDFADLLFGQVLPEDLGDKAKSLNLRGRANFGLFRQVNDVGLGPEEKAILLAPKYGFYPSLLRQNADGKPPKVRRYKTLQEDSARLRGPSRYMASRGAKVEGPTSGMSTTDAVYTKFRPVGEGAKFRGQLRFFNLKPEELGALVWCLHWGENTCPEGFAHMLGAAKTFGFGACRMRIDRDAAKIRTNADYQDAADPGAVLDEALKTFEAHMNTAMKEIGVSGDWRQTPQIKELLATADLNHGDKLRASGQLTPMSDPKAFVQAKKDRDVLPLPSGAYEPPLAGASTRPVGNRGNASPQAARAAGFRKGQRVIFIEENEEVTVLEDAPAGGDVLIQFDDGDTETVDAKLLSKT